jgi:hypothetical protein
MTPQEIDMFGATLAVMRMAYIWRCILYLREDAVCFIVFGNQTSASFSGLKYAKSPKLSGLAL